VNEAFDDAGGSVAEAVGGGAVAAVGAGGGVEPPPVRLVSEEQPVSVATIAAAPAACRQASRRDPMRQRMAAS